MSEKIIILIVCHLIGDYVLQSEFIANTKGNNCYHLFVHCVLYCVPFLIMYGFVWQLVVTFILHLIVDPLKARYKQISYVQDQLIHYLTLVLYLI